MTIKEELEKAEKNLPVLSTVTDRMAKDAERESRICYIISFASIFVSVVLNVLALVLLIPALWILGTTFLLISICFYFESEKDHVKFLALSAHADQVRLLNVITVLLQAIDEGKDD